MSVPPAVCDCSLTCAPRDAMRCPPAPLSAVTVWDTMNVTKQNVTAGADWLKAMSDAAQVRAGGHVPLTAATV